MRNPSTQLNSFLLPRRIAGGAAFYFAVVAFAAALGIMASSVVLLTHKRTPTFDPMKPITWESVR